MEMKHTYADLENYYVNKGYKLEFLHIPSGRKVWFKGLITALSDKYQSEWNDEQVYGRSDPISTFKHTKRVISITWDVVAAHADEAKENMRKVSLLMTMLYPVYSGKDGGASSISTSPLFKVSFGNLIQNVNQGIFSGIVGKVDGFDFTPNMQEQFFDVSNGVLYPQSLTLSCNLTIFHTHALGWGEDKNPRQKKFPYGEDVGEESGYSDVKTTSGVTSTSGTREQQSAMENKILKGLK